METLEYHSKILLYFPQYGRLRIDGFSVFHCNCLLAKVRQITAVHRFKHCRAPQQCRFSRSRRADDGEHLALFHFERNIFQNFEIPKALSYMVHFQINHIVFRSPL